MYLNAHSWFSWRYGTLPPEELAAAAAGAGVGCLALTDINNTSGAFPFWQACRAQGIKPVFGIEFRRDHRLLYIGLARNREGMYALCRLLSEHSLSGTPLPDVAPPMPDTFIIYPQLPRVSGELLPNEFVGIRAAGLPRLFRSPLMKYRHALLALHSVSFADADGYRLHKLLRCIHHNCILGKLPAGACASASDFPQSPAWLSEQFKAYPDLLQRTAGVLEQCSMDMETGIGVNRQRFTENEHDDVMLLRKLAESGCRRRYGDKNRRAWERMNKELGVIVKLGFTSYFLITWDIVRYGRSAGYYHVGRGSGANSIVAFCLGITDVDPLELDLYFERFINPHRSSPPDFDIDFSWDERDDVTDYVFKRYGAGHTALLATYSTFKGKSIIRELGKVLGLPKADIDTLVSRPNEATLHHPFARHIFRYGERMASMPNHLSIHAGGILVSSRPLYYHTALQMMPKGFPVVQFDMYTAEDIGFHKFDVLSQRGLGHIKDAVDLVRNNRGEEVNIHDIQRIKHDPAVMAELRSGHCTGCFYIESPAMRGLLQKLKCDNYVHLVAASSIIRPGVAKSGMMRAYIERFHQPAKIEYLHKVFEKHLGETFGIMVYQEDVMKVVHHFAGLDLDESDVLRRIMTGKRKTSDTFLRLRDKFFRNCTAYGYPDTLSREVWRQIESFSGYSFCKAHSASFAVESFQSLYLRAHYPLEFMVGVINNFGGFYRTELYVHEARMLGGQIEPPCVNHSQYLTGISGRVIHLGFVHLNGLERNVALGIIDEREQGGPFLSFADFLRRVNIPRSQLRILIRIGAFRFTGLSKYQLMWERNRLQQTAQAQPAGMFGEPDAEYRLPAIAPVPFEQAFDEIELLGFPLCSPFDLLKTTFRGEIMAGDLALCEGRTVRMVGYYVCRKNVTTINRKLMNFGTWLDAQGRFFDTVHFPQALAAWPFSGPGCYLIMGKVVSDFGVPSVEVSKMARLPYISDSRY